MQARSSSLALSLSAALVLGCGGGTTAATDAGPTDDTRAPVDAGPRMLSFRRGDDYPGPVAYATATILPVGTQRYLYVAGGANATRDSLGTIYATCTRAEIHDDGSLGAWESAGDIDGGSGPIAIVGHGAIRLNGDSGDVGIAVAGGGGPGGSLPVVLSGFVQVDGTLGHWGRYDPTLTMGQSFGAFMPFEAHQLALVGGLSGASGSEPTDRVVIAAIMNGTMSPVWRDGPTLPEPRFGHAWFQVGTDLFVIGGENADGGVSDVLRTTRDATTLDVDGWATVGTLLTTTSFPAAFVHGGQVWLAGGLDGGRATGAAGSRVSRADLGADGHVGAFTRVAGGDLPLPLGASAVAYDAVTGHVYMVGGLTGEPLAATAAVVIGTLP